MGWFKHAFAVEDPADAVPTPEQQPVVDWLCRAVARRHLTTPGLIFLQITKPLNYVASMSMRVFQPTIWALFNTQRHEHYVHFAKFLEKRGSMEYLCQRVEHFEEEFTKMQEEREANAGDSKRSRKRRSRTQHHHRDEPAADQDAQADPEKDQPHE